MSAVGTDDDRTNGNDSSPATDNGINEGWFSRWRKDPGTTVPGLAAVILGFAVGVLTGASGPDATVLAAVLPAVLSAVGIVIGFLSTRGDSGKRRTRAVGGLIILFSAGLLVGTWSGATVRDLKETAAYNMAADEQQKAQAEQQEAQKEALEAARRRHIADLESCTYLELRVNNQRAALELPPVTISQVCPFLDDPHSTLR